MKHKPFNIDALETEINQVVDSLNSSLPPIEYLPTTYREKRREEDAASLEKLTIEAIQISHESAATALDALGSEIKERIKRMDAIRIEAAEQLAMCRDLAEEYRDAGRQMSVKIELTQADLAESRRVIETLRNQIKSTIGE